MTQFVQRVVKNKIIQNILAQVRLRLLPLICHKRVLHNCGLKGLQIATVPTTIIHYECLNLKALRAEELVCTYTSTYGPLLTTL